MNKLPSVERLCQLFELRDGHLYWRVSKGGSRAGVRAGCPDRGYIRVMVDGRTYAVHRLIWMMNFGPIPDGIHIDHIDGNPGNNKIENLRLATNAENQRNRQGANADSKSGIRGVSPRRDGGWRANVQVDGREITRTFKSIYAAAVYADLLRWKYHGEFAQPTPGLWDHAY